LGIENRGPARRCYPMAAAQIRRVRSNNHRGMEGGGLVCAIIVKQCGKVVFIAPSSMDTMTCLVMIRPDMFSCCSVAGDATEVARALVHSSEERIKSAQAAISSPRRRYFRLNVQAMSSFAGVWNVRGIRAMASAELMICSVRPVNRRKRLDSRLPFRYFVGSVTCRMM